MKTATAHIKSVSPMQQSRYHGLKKTDEESYDDFENRTWIERCHYDEDENVFIPPMAFKIGIMNAAKYLDIKVAGMKGNMTKSFTAGVLVTDPVYIGLKKSDAVKMMVFCSADGRRNGSGPRVEKHFPTFMAWKGAPVFHILDERITEEMFVKVLKHMGALIGVGTFRPANGGFYGRFEVEKVKWEDA